MSSGEGVAGNVIGAGYQVAVAIPCYNEKRVAARVVADFRAAPPGAAIYVYDNNLTDTAAAALRAPGEEWRRS